MPGGGTLAPTAVVEAQLEAVAAIGAALRGTERKRKRRRGMAAATLLHAAAAAWWVAATAAAAWRVAAAAKMAQLHLHHSAH